MATRRVDRDEEDGSTICCAPLRLDRLLEPIDIDGPEARPGEVKFSTWPVFGPLLFTNESSDARDHCANERTFLSYLRLSVYMAIVSTAIVLSFHLKSQPSNLELKMAKPLGFIFWVLSVCCLFMGIGNYITTVNKYSRRAAIVQTGWKTQALLATVTVSIVGTCIVLLVVAKISTDGSES